MSTATQPEPMTALRSRMRLRVFRPTHRHLVILILIASDHDETATVAFGVDTNSTSIITYVSVNSSTEAYEPGGSIASNGGFNCNNCAVFGLTLTANGNTDFVISGNDRAYFRECSLTANQL